MIAWKLKVGQATGEWWYAEIGSGDSLSLFPPTLTDHRWSMIAAVAVPVNQTTHVHLSTDRPTDGECLVWLQRARISAKLFTAMLDVAP